MPLDPNAAALVAQLVPPGTPSPVTLPLAEWRQRMLESFLLLGGPRVPLDRIEDTVLGGVPVRLYRPTALRVLPVLVYYHGGGWTLGSLETHDAMLTHLARMSGWAVASVEYRLAPEHKFPIPVLDCWAALQGVFHAAGSLGFDREQIAVGGDSAGGNLGAVMTFLARDYGLPLAGQALIYPVADAVSSRPSYDFDYLLRRSSMEAFFEHYLHHGSQVASPLVSPLRQPDLAGLPPALVITAEFDPLRDEGNEYAAALAAAGVAVEHTCYPGLIHAFLNMPAVLPQAWDGLEQFRRFLQRLSSESRG